MFFLFSLQKKNLGKTGRGFRHYQQLQGGRYQLLNMQLGPDSLEPTPGPPRTPSGEPV